MNRTAALREAAGHRVLHLEVGQPSTGAPAAAVDAVARVLRDDPGPALGYTEAAGLPSLRRRIAQHYRERHDVDVDEARILVVSGASAGFTLAFLAAFDTGARVGVVEPGYPCYRNTLAALDMEPVPLVVGPEHRWVPTAEMIEAAGPLDGLVIASPSNPTGTVLQPDAQRAIVTTCGRLGIRLVADEIYHGITYGRAADTVLAVTDRAVVINSFSKYFSMTGWRVGWMVVPVDLTDAVERLQQNLYICAPHISQVAALGAMDARDELDRHVERYATNRSILLEGLALAGIGRVADADGAFYVYADVEHLTTGLAPSAGGPLDSMTLCHRWLDEIGVACTPGVDFDLSRGDQFVRFSYAGSSSDVAEAAALLERWAP